MRKVTSLHKVLNLSLLLFFFQVVTHMDALALEWQF